jgi:hypothetical protein
LKREIQFFLGHLNIFLDEKFEKWKSNFIGFILGRPVNFSFLQYLKKKTKPILALFWVIK